MTSHSLVSDWSLGEVGRARFSRCSHLQMKGWRQRRPGSERNTFLTRTGLLMEGDYTNNRLDALLHSWTHLRENLVDLLPYLLTAGWLQISHSGLHAGAKWLKFGSTRNWRTEVLLETNQIRCGEKTSCATACICDRSANNSVRCGPGSVAGQRASSHSGYVRSAPWHYAPGEYPRRCDGLRGPRSRPHHRLGTGAR